MNLLSSTKTFVENELVFPISLSPLERWSMIVSGRVNLGCFCETTLLHGLITLDVVVTDEIDLYQQQYSVLLYYL